MRRSSSGHPEAPAGSSGEANGSGRKPAPPDRGPAASHRKMRCQAADQCRDSTGRRPLSPNRGLVPREVTGPRASVPAHGKPRPPSATSRRAPASPRRRQRDCASSPPPRAVTPREGVRRRGSACLAAGTRRPIARVRSQSRGSRRPPRLRITHRRAVGVAPRVRGVRLQGCAGSPPGGSAYSIFIIFAVSS
jgi:hypothetical protein